MSHLVCATFFDSYFYVITYTLFWISAQPIARSTHVVINETVEEEMEIDETSPKERISKINGGMFPHLHKTKIL